MAKPMFGVLLEEVPTVNGVPLPVYELISYLTERKVRLEVEGLFRISGKLADIVVIKEMYNKREYVDLSKYDIHTVAAVLKAFFRELPDSLVTHENTDMIIATVQMDEKFRPTKIKNIQNILSFLPPIYYETLKLLILYLKQIADHSNINKMTTSNISMIFGVNIFTGVGVVDLLSKENTACFRSTSFLIDNCHEIFAKPKPSPSNLKKQPLIGRSSLSPTPPDSKIVSTSQQNTNTQHRSSRPAHITPYKPQHHTAANMDNKSITPPILKYPNTIPQHNSQQTTLQKKYQSSTTNGNNVIVHTKSQSGPGAVSTTSSAPKFVPTKPVPSKPIPSKPIPSKPIPSKPIPSKPTPTKPTPTAHPNLVSERPTPTKTNRELPQTPIKRKPPTFPFQK
ncbi:Rho-GAP domain-containing protein [Entamoeba marina]